MKLNYDCLRKLLLTLESELIMEDDLYYPVLRLHEVVEKMPDYSRADIVYTSVMAKEAGLISANIIDADAGIIDCAYLSLTYEGHQFLDTVRSNKIWNKTKSVLSTIGSASFNIIISVATDVIKSLIHP